MSSPLFEIIVFKQRTIKEDKKVYDIVSTKSYLNRDKDLKVLKKGVNTFMYIKKVLANTDVTNISAYLSDFNFKSDDVEDNTKESISGVFHLISVCITPNGEYVSAYVLQQKGPFLTHKTVKAPNLVINNDGTIMF